MRKLTQKKGVMGLDVAKAFVVGLLSLILIGVVTMIVLVQLGDLSIVSSDNDNYSKKTQPNRCVTKERR
jgi:hypothetical protein